jgi:hypothetical protein
VRPRPAAAALLVAVVALDALAGGPRSSLNPLATQHDDPAPALATLLRRGLPPVASTAASHSAAPAPLDAYLVTSPRDCVSNLGALDLLARESIAPRIRLAAALVTAPSRQHDDARASATDDAALGAVRDAIAARDLPVPPVRVLDPPTAALLRRMGYHSTPFLVVLDSAGSLRFASASARSFADYQDLARTLAALADRR